MELKSIKQKPPYDNKEDVSQFLFNLMENYSDSVIPSFSQLNPNPIIIKQEPIFSESDPSSSIKRPKLDHYSEPHFPLNPCSSSKEKLQEKDRDRRASIKLLVSVLQSMLPNPDSNVTVAKVVAGATKYIKELEGVVEGLEGQKIQRTTMYTSPDSNINVVVSGEIVFFEMYMVVGRGLVAKILMVFEKNNVGILTANACVSGGVIRLSVVALVNNGDDERDVVVERIKWQIGDLLGSW
ncbi:hypothetical protein ACHQM5_026732 [Ranunculus cassubicifolius]